MSEHHPLGHKPRQKIVLKSRPIPNGWVILGFVSLAWSPVILLILWNHFHG